MRFISSQDHRWKLSNIIGFYLFFSNCGFIAFVLHVYENWKAELIVQNPWNLKRNSFPFKQRCPRYYFSGYKFSHTHTHLLYVFFFLLSPSGFNGRVPKQLITNLPPIFFIAFLPSMFLFVFSIAPISCWPPTIRRAMRNSNRQWEINRYQNAVIQVSYSQLMKYCHEM